MVGELDEMQMNHFLLSCSPLVHALLLGSCLHESFLKPNKKATQRQLYNSIRVQVFSV